MKTDRIKRVAAFFSRSTQARGSALFPIGILLRIWARFFYDPWVLYSGHCFKGFLAALRNYKVPVVSEIEMIKEHAFPWEREDLLEGDAGVGICGPFRNEGIGVYDFLVPAMPPGEKFKEVIPIKPNGILNCVVQIKQGGIRFHLDNTDTLIDKKSPGVGFNFQRPNH